MTIDENIEMLDDIIEHAQSVPFSVKKGIVDIDQVRDCLNDIRMSIPQEVKQAKLIVQDRKSIIAEAKKEEERIIRQAEERAKQIISNNEITLQAKQRAAEIITQAQEKSKEIRNATNEYIENVLNQAEQVLAANLTDLKKTRQAVKQVNKQ